jgi:LPS-assembly protein
LQIDPYQGKTTQVYAAAKWTPKRLTTLSLSYRYQRDPYADEERTNINQGNPLSYQLQGKETVSFAGQWPFTSKLYGVGRVDYSLKESRVTQHILGLEYKGDCCWTGRVVLKRYAVSKQDSNSAIFFQLELAGLGSVGKDPMDLLRQNVPGYESVNTPVPARTSFERYE